MEKLTITLELTLEEVRFVVNELWQFRAAKQEANKQQHEPQPLMLQYGKRYKRRDGKITAPLMSCDSITYPFTDGNKGWTPRGFYYKTEEPHPYDLIEEA